MMSIALRDEVSLPLRWAPWERCLLVAGTRCWFEGEGGRLGLHSPQRWQLQGAPFISDLPRESQWLAWVSVVMTHQVLVLSDTEELFPIGTPALCSGHGKALPGYPALVWKMVVLGTRQAGQGCAVVEAASRLRPSPDSHGVLSEAVLEGSLFCQFARGAV